MSGFSAVRISRQMDGGKEGRKEQTRQKGRISEVDGEEKRNKEAKGCRGRGKGVKRMVPCTGGGSTALGIKWVEKKYILCDERWGRSRGIYRRCLSCL